MPMKMMIFAEILRQLRDIPDPSYGEGKPVEMDEMAETMEPEEKGEVEDEYEKEPTVRGSIEKAMKKG